MNTRVNKCYKNYDTKDYQVSYTQEKY